MVVHFLERQGWRVNYFCLSRGPRQRGILPESVEFTESRGRFPIADLKLIASIRRCVEKNKKNVIIYVQGHTAAALVESAFRFRLLPERPVVYHSQDFLGPGHHRLYERMEGCLARRAKLVVCNEINRAKAMQVLYGLAECPLVVPTSLPTWWQLPECGIYETLHLVKPPSSSDGEERCIVVAGGGYRKDRMSDKVLSALTVLPESFAVVFTGMSEGSDTSVELADMCVRLKISERVFSLPTLPYNSLLSLFGICDLGLLLYPSDSIGHFYQCPGRLTEYLSMGVTPIMSNFPGFERLNLKYGIGDLCNAYDPGEIAAACVRQWEQRRLNSRQDKLRNQAYWRNNLVYEIEGYKLEAALIAL
jgi:hypothetical protein